MSLRYTNHYSTNNKGVTKTHQSKPIPGKESLMVKNNAGGFTFQVDDWKRLKRFLILGTEGGTFYVDEKTLTIDNAKVVERCAATDGEKTVNEIVEISKTGRAPKNGPALFALAICASSPNENTRRAALRALPLVARTGTHLFEFAEYVQNFRGWGRTLRTAMADWYQSKDVDDLVYQLMKYKNRNGWSHRDVLRLAHPKTNDKVRNIVYKWVTKPEDVKLHTYKSQALVRLAAAENAATSKDAKVVSNLIREFDLPREVVNTELLNDVNLWKALLVKMPMTAMIRNLGKMTSIGLLKDNNNETIKVVETLTNKEQLKKARVHPLSILVALKTYEQGHGEKGSLSWKPVQSIVDALDEAFYAAFDFVQSTGKRFFLGLDVSGSMDGGQVAGMPITPRVAAAAMAMVTARTEKFKTMMGFSHKLVETGISSKDSLDTVIKKMREIPMGGTDCSLPIVYALKNKIPVDVFIVYTDNETWFGNQHPIEALKEYRKKMGIDAKLVVVAFAGTKFTIADPTDMNTLDVVGFDTATPQVISDFSLE